VRAQLAVALLALSGCWNGADALHLPCTNDEHCGRGQSCVDGFCDGPPRDTAAGSEASSSASSSGGASTNESGTDTGETCGTPDPTTCQPTMRPATRSLVAREVVEPLLGRSNAVAAGDFLGDPRIDIAVVSRDEYTLVVLENAGETWPAAPSHNTLTEINDMLTVDVDGDSAIEFVLMSGTGEIEVVTWDNAAFAPVDLLQLPVDFKIAPLISFTAADVLGADSFPELIVSSSSTVYLVPNDEGILLDDAAGELSGMFFEPRDTLVVGEGADLRVLVTESDNTSIAGDANQDVHALRVVDGALVAGSLATDFRNPWALAQGDFLGDDGLEIVVAERRLDGSTPDVDGTSTTGRLRFFRMQDAAFVEVGEPLEVGIGPAVLAAADLDCDGKTDLVIGNTGTAGQDDGSPQVLFGSCEESARASDLLTLGPIGGSGLSPGSRLAVGDFDGNGLLEVAIPDTSDILLPEDVGQRVVFVGVQEAP
jgi:hypothetical protein